MPEKKNLIMHHALRPKTRYNVWVPLIGSKQIRHGCEMRDSFYTKSRALHFYEPLTTLTLKAGFYFEIRQLFPLHHKNKPRYMRFMVNSRAFVRFGSM